MTQKFVIKESELQIAMLSFLKHKNKRIFKLPIVGNWIEKRAINRLNNNISDYFDKHAKKRASIKPINQVACAKQKSKPNRKLLLQKLQRALYNENYEAAAILRDQINKI